MRRTIRKPRLNDTAIGKKTTSPKMAPKLDIQLAIKLVKPFDGTTTLLNAYIESVELLMDYAEGVEEKDILKFVKTTLIGIAHGVIDSAGSINQAFDLLRSRFSVHLTPLAVEREILSLKQGSKTISEFGHELEKMAAKLAAAHVSSGTFQTEYAAQNIVNPIAVRAFIQGLNKPNTKFFLQARNPSTLNRAISDALECEPRTSVAEDREMTLWCSPPRYMHRYTRRPQNSYHPRSFYNQSYRGSYSPHFGSENQIRYTSNSNRRPYRGRHYSHNHPQPNANIRNNATTRVHLGNVNPLEPANDTIPESDIEQDEIINLFR